MIMAYERRVKARFPVELNVRYQVLGTSGMVAGVGQTVNMSSSGMLVSCASDVPEGTRIKIFVEWPSLLNGTTPLQLIAVGTVVRRDDSGLSISFESYQFRTMGRAAQHSNVTQMPERISTGYGAAKPKPLSLVADSSS